MTKKEYYIKKSENQKEYLILDKKDNHCVGVLDIEQINQGIKDWINSIIGKRMTEKKRYTYLNSLTSSFTGSFFCNGIPLTNQEVVKLLEENEQLKKDVDYWKQVASQYSNELNAFEHYKKHKDIHWSSD